jgi:hypothetical protein
LSVIILPEPGNFYKIFNTEINNQEDRKSEFQYLSPLRKLNYLPQSHENNILCKPVCLSIQAGWCFRVLAANLLFDFSEQAHIWKVLEFAIIKVLPAFKSRRTLADNQQNTVTTFLL